jgi:hypothetical protein
VTSGPAEQPASGHEASVPAGPGDAGPEDVDASQRPDVAREHDQEGDLENPGAAI